MKDRARYKAQTPQTKKSLDMVDRYSALDIFSISSNDSNKYDQSLGDSSQEACNVMTEGLLSGMQTGKQEQLRGILAVDMYLAAYRHEKHNKILKSRIEAIQGNNDDQDGGKHFR